MDYEKKKKFIIDCMYVCIIMALVFIAMKYGLGLIAPFVIAFIIAYLLRKPTIYISKKFNLPYKPVALLFVLLFYSTIGLLLVLLGIKAISLFTALLASLPELYATQISPLLTTFLDLIEETFIKMDPSLLQSLTNMSTQITKSITELLSNISVQTVTAVSSYATTLPGFFIKFLLMIISSFFIAIDFEIIITFFQRQFSSKTNDLFIHVKEYLVGTLFVCIRSYALIMSITFIELSIGLTIIGIDNAIVIALIISVFDILPVLGTGGIMIPWTILTAAQGNFTLAFGLLAVYLIITVIRNILEPKIVGAQIGLHPVVTLISMFIGAQLFGLLGLFGLPIFLSLLKNLNDSGTIKLFK